MRHMLFRITALMWLLGVGWSAVDMLGKHVPEHTIDAKTALSGLFIIFVSMLAGYFAGKESTCDRNP